MDDTPTKKKVEEKNKGKKELAQAVEAEKTSWFKSRVELSNIQL